jgi:hypothetical protein
MQPAPPSRGVGSLFPHFPFREQSVEALKQENVETVKMCGVTGLVEEAFAANRSAETRNAVRGVHFALKLVVVGEFLVCRSVSIAHQSMRSILC